MATAFPVGAEKYLVGECSAAEAVGDAVYISGTSNGRPAVRKVDRTNPAKMPARGVIVKKAGTVCIVQMAGVVGGGIYSGLTPNKSMFVAADGTLTETPPARPVTGQVYRQTVAFVISSTSILVQTEAPLILVGA